MGKATVGDQTVAGFLDCLAARQPTPGGGATAALSVAQAAALVAMVARYSDSPKYETHRQQISDAMYAADESRQHALRLAADDEDAFAAVAAAYSLRRGSEDEKVKRRTAIADALAGAAEPPIQVVAAAERVVGLAAGLVAVSNANLIADLAAAADAARAGAGIGRVNIQVNLSGIRDDAVRARCVDSLDQVTRVQSAADAVIADVLARLSGAAA